MSAPDPALASLSPELLIEQLASASWSARRALVEALAARGEEALGALLSALRARRDDEARVAALVDALVGSTADVEAVLHGWIDEPDAQVLADVAQVLGRRRRLKSVPPLARLTRNADDNVAVAAIEALGRIGGHGIVEALVACIESGHFFRVFPALDVLGRTGDPRAIAPLAQLLENPRYALEAARALGRTGDRTAVAPLAGLLSSPSAATVRIACQALADLLESHLERYGSAGQIQGALKALRTPALVRRLGQNLASADRVERVALCRVLAALQDSSAASHLTPLLHAEPEVARAAAAALREIGRDSDASIEAALREPHSRGRAFLLPEVTQLAHADAVESCLSDPDPNVRTLAAEALARIGSARSTPALFALLDDESARVVHAASAAIQALGSGETEPLALAAARSPRIETRRAALRILGYFGYESALALFASGLEEQDARVREASVQGLALLELPEARALLIAASEAHDPRLRASAMRALGQTAPDPALLALLERALGDEDPWVRYYACQALGRQHADAATAAVVALLADPAGQVRVAAVEALAHLPNERALEGLRAASGDRDVDIRRAALIGLGIRRDVSSLPTLIDAARGEDHATRLVALSAVAAFDDERVTPALLAAVSDPEESVRTAALGFLSAAPGEAATLGLLELLADGQVQAGALEALARPHEARVRVLSRGLLGADDELLPLLASTLVKLRDKDAAEALIRGLTLPNRAARIACANALVALGTRDAYAALALAAREDSDLEVRRVCALHLVS